MPITRGLIFVAILIVLAGCGVQSPLERDRSGVADLARVLRDYNAAPVHNLSEQATICQQAWTQADAIPQLAPVGHARSRHEATLLNAARVEAVVGFHDCARAAKNLNYPLMVEAQAELASANDRVARARAGG